MMMSTAVQTTIAPRGYWSDLEYLLLGDLRQVLDEPSTLLRDRWLVSLLDVLLAGYRQDRPQGRTHIPEGVIVDRVTHDRMIGNQEALSQRLSTCATSTPSSYEIPSPFTPASIRNDFLTGEREQLYSKLQRLRDRVAHRTPSNLLSNEIRCDLQDLMPV